MESEEIEKLVVSRSITQPEIKNSYASGKFLKIP
jgi:hypothetical protein